MDTNKAKGGSMGLSYPMLTKCNYTTWALKMKVVMQAHSVWEAIEPNDPKAVCDERTDKIALAMIYQGISEEMLLSIAEKKKAKDAWVAIKTLCQGADKAKAAKIQTLKSEFESLVMKEDEQIDDFSMKLTGIATNIRALGEKLEESYVVKKFFRAVPNKFLQIVSTMEQFGNMETLTVEEVVGSLKAHEERTKGMYETSGGQSSGGQLLLTEEEWSKKEKEEGKLLLTREEWMKRNERNRGDGMSNWKGRSGGRDRSRLRCFNCFGYGHFAADCKKPKKTREVRQEANMVQIEDEESALLLAKHTEENKNLVLLNEKEVVPRLNHKGDKKGVESSVWYLDNGASNHMTGDKAKFRELNEKITGQVKFGDGSMVTIEGKGSIALKCKNGEERILKEVYYIPTLCSNIISIGQLSEEGNRVVIKGNFLWVYDDTERLIIKVQRSQNRLYKLLVETSNSACLMSKSSDVSWLWHMRMGHVNYKSLVMMNKDQMVHGLPKIIPPNVVCDGCLMSKQARKPFPAKANYSATKVLQLVHVDLCGPIQPSTSAGNKYFMLLVDDFSRAMWVFMLKQKDEALDMFKKFRALVEDGDEKKIRVLRSDRGGEFSSKEFVNYCEQSGITRHYTAPYSPQQNGVVERRNRTVVEMARGLLKEMGLPAEFWGEAVRHAVYLLNRLPTRALSGQTPYEAWTKVKPNISHIRVFGCIAHMKIPSIHMKKLDDRSKKVVNLGKEPGTKAYRLYDPITKRVHVSRDVIFEEAESWPWKSTIESGTNNDHDSFSILEALDNRHEVERIDIADAESGAATETESEGSDMESPGLQSPASTENSDNYDDSNATRKYRSLYEVYNDSQEVELEDELYLMGTEEPNTYRQASSDKDWRLAMQQEMNSIEQNGTWKLTELPKDQKVIGLKWVYKLKKDAEGNIVKHKARLVAKGYSQEQGVDFEESFAPVTRLETVRLLLALAAHNKWEVHHLDVKTAFLNGEIKEEVFVSQPEGYVQKGKEHMVYKLLKALYGLRQAPRAWYSKLNKCLEEMGFIRCPYEHAVYTKQEGKETLIISVYVDDLLVTGTSMMLIEEFKKKMSSCFEMSDLGKLNYYLGMEVDQGKEYIELKQTGYAKKILERAGMLQCNATKYPMDPKDQIHKDEQGIAVDSTRYKSMVGGLRYLVHTRPDIAYAVGVVSRYMERPTTMHQDAVKRILRYIKGTLNFGLIYTRDSGNNELVGFSDSDLGGHLDDRKSTGGVVFYLNESVITWVSQKQRCVALSSCEAEFMAVTAAACQGIWLKNVLGQILNEKLSPVVLYVDNKSAIDLAKNPVFHGRSKHIDIRYHFIRDCVEKGDIVIKYVRSDLQKADILTKALTTVKFERMRQLMGVKRLEETV